MHKETYAGGRDRLFPLQKKVPASPKNRGHRQLCLQAVQPLETTDQPQNEVLISDIFNSHRQ